MKGKASVLLEHSMGTYFSDLEEWKDIYKIEHKNTNHKEKDLQIEQDDIKFKKFFS